MLDSDHHDAQAQARTAPDDGHWYKDAIIYQTHVKAFADSNGDGIGDFKGLTERLDYIRDLGVTAVWLLPFYPSPQRDDGYDIAEYQAVHPDYGTMNDAKVFIREAHARELRVITELIINHTSDQHPWFQAARHAPKGSPERDFYVWSDDDTPYADSRIIFTDTESSNWAWDPVAGQYYWHRFFSHQPDLNFDNPAVLKAVLDVMGFWLDLGVDGLRLDAIPYLIEREGSSCENLRETHDVLKSIRAALDARYADRMLLAEANQWPEDVREYFGAGDECHMAYHFPVMPRMYMALAQEDRHPIIDIMAQTPDIPSNCQWAIFLRNHDELTLEMVTDRERDYMYRQYAADPRMRVNVGIRRRLAPLLDNDLGRIKLMKSLLFSLLGTPVLYYGDEIGMGDNVYLGDRNGVRTPMQWSPDRNGGFSRADPQRLYLPPIMDPTFGFESVNVEAQSRTPASLLNWTRRMITVRKRHVAFGRGALRFLAPGNRKVLAYVREHVTADGDRDVVLCVANLSRTPQPVELDLHEFEGAVPVELSGRTAFPPIGKLPYLLTLAGHGFYWFDLASDADEPIWHTDALAPAELPVFVIDGGWSAFTDAADASDTRGERAGAVQAQLSRRLPDYLLSQRWFAAKAERSIDVAIERQVHLAGETGHPGWLLVWIRVALPGADQGASEQRYFLPLALAWEAQAEDLANSIGTATLARTRHHARVGIVFDAFHDDAFCRRLIAMMATDCSMDTGAGSLLASRTAVFDSLVGSSIDSLVVEPAAAQGSNTAIVIGPPTGGLDELPQRAFLKGYRRVRQGINPELELGRHLTERSDFDRIAPLAGAIEWRDGDTSMALASLQGFTPNQGDAWHWTLDYLERFEEDELRAPPPRAPADPSPDRDDPQVHAGFLTLMHTLGRRTAGMHVGLLDEADPAFTLESMTHEELTSLASGTRQAVDRALQVLNDAVDGMDDVMGERVSRLLDRREALFTLLDEASGDAIRGACKSRVHGDYHLQQVLVDSNDFVIIDFEGEPGRPLAQRRAKTSALKDVAGMLRSIDYAASSARLRALEFRDDVSGTIEAGLEHWRVQSSEAFLRGWRETAAQASLWPDDGGERLLALYTIEKAVYELRYELDNRPDWIGVPVAGLLRMTNAD